MPPKRNQKKGGSSQASRTASKVASKVPSRQDTPVPGTPASEPAKPVWQGETVVGINFGQTASSIAVINKEGLADCIANDDGDRQIATAVSFAGDQVYVGNPARQQLVRNNENTVLGFRDVLGKTYDEVKSVQPLFNTAALVSKDGVPAYTVSTSPSPDAEPIPKTLTVDEVALIYLRTLISYASDYLGRPITGAVLSIPSSWTPSQRSALSSVAKEIGVRTLQFVDAAGAVAVAYGLTGPSDSPKAPAVTAKASEVSSTKEAKPDSNVVVLDVGGSSTTATVLAARAGLFVSLASVTDSSVGGHDLDARLVEHFAKEFTKKTKVPLDVSTTVAAKGAQHRAGMKLRLAAEVSKRTLSASTSANCSVDSLADGMDFSGSINRMRFDLLAAKAYGAIVGAVEKAVKQSGVEREAIDEVILVGGTTKLPAIADRVAALFPESTQITTTVETDEAVAMGCALHARGLVEAFPPPIPDPAAGTSPSLDSTEWAATKGVGEAKALDITTLSRPLGILVPSGASSPAEAVVDGKVFATLVAASTPLPLRRTFEIAIAVGAKEVALDLWEGQDVVHVDQPPVANGKTAKGGASDSEDEEEDEPTRTAIVKPVSPLARIQVPTEGGKKVTLELAVEQDGSGKVGARIGSGQTKEAAF